MRSTSFPRIIFLGTAAFAVPALEALVASKLSPVAVYTREDKPAGRGRAPRPSPVKERATAFGLPILQPKTLRTSDAVAELRRLAPTVLVLASYGLLLPPPFLDVAPRGGINIHPSLLPRHRGPSPVASTILAGDPEAGITIFLMDQGMDSGPLLSQRRVAIRNQETAGELTDRLAREGAALMVETLGRWLSGEILPQAQDENRATQSPKFTKEDGRLNFSRPAVELERQVRALNPWPIAFTTLDGKRLHILRAETMPGVGQQPGRVTAIEGSGTPAVGVATADGVLRLLEVQMEGKRALPADEFARGRRDFLGSTLPS